MSKEVLQFGVCYVGQRRELQILLSNPTGSDSYWTAELEQRSASCSDDTFSLTPCSGKLDAHITHVTNSKTLLKIYFTARHTEEYEAVYVFRGMLGEEVRRLTCVGSGSYDGKHEAQINI